MNASDMPWLELALATPLAAALGLTFVRHGPTAARWGLTALTLNLFWSVAAALAASGAPPALISKLGTFSLDAAAAPIAPVLALVHLLKILGTAKARVSSSFCVRVLLSAFITVATLSAGSDRLVVGLLGAAALLPIWDLVARGRSIRGYLVYAIPTLACLGIGFAGRDAGYGWGASLLMIGLLIYGGVFPLHGWLPSLFMAGSFGVAMLRVLSMLQIFVALRLVVPLAEPSLLAAAAMAALATAVYAAGMAVVQRDPRRFFAYLSLSQTALVTFAVMLRTPGGLTAGLCLWISAALSLAGLAFSLRALEGRFGLLSLRDHHGLYEQVPSLAICFLLSGLACVGFPGTIGFVPMELLISDSFEHGLWVAVVLALVAMLSGIAMLRAYFSLFTGRRRVTSVSLNTTTAERIGIVIIVLAVILGGWLSPAIVASGHAAADALLGAAPGVEAAH